MGGMANKGFGKFKATAQFDIDGDKEYIRTDGEESSKLPDEYEKMYLDEIARNGCEARFDLLGK